MKKKVVLITGIAGFIGFSLAKKLLLKKVEVVGIDSFNNYYDTKIKYRRILELKKINKKIIIIKDNLQNYKKLKIKLKKYKILKLFHLAAQAGVRHSIKNPRDYVDNNLIAFSNILELARYQKTKHLVFASSSSVYGNKNNTFLSEEKSNADFPIQFYGATKRANEIMAYSYSHLYKIPVSICRLFTVYGPWGRPDMALYIFVKNIISGKKINLFNRGNHQRSFSYIDDVVNGLILVGNKIPKKKLFETYNISSGKYIYLKQYLKAIEKELGLKAQITLSKLQDGDVKSSIADISKIKKIGFKSKTPLNVGIKKFVLWYKNYHKIK